MSKKNKEFVGASLIQKRRAWYLYDWANSAYSTTVITLFLGPFLTTLAKSIEKNNLVNFFGFHIPAGSVFPYSISISVLLQALLLPIIGSLADLTKRKTIYLAIFTIIGSLSTILFFFINSSIFILGSLLLIISNLAFGAAVVIYNSFLNEIADIDEREVISSKGWAIGYLGGGTLLLINLILFLNYEKIGLSQIFAIKINIALAGIWWALFSIPIITKFKTTHSSVFKKNKLKIIKDSFSQLYSTLKNSTLYPTSLLFLVAYLFYNDGVQSVISLSSQFGQEELKLNISFLTIVILVVQFVAAFGSMIFMKISLLFNEKKSILFAIFIWMLILIYAFTFLKGSTDFLILAIIIALVMGGIQSISRSLFSKLIPEGKEAEYFSLYEVSEKGTSWMGPFLFGLIYQYTFSYRYAILSLIVFFIIGGIILLFTKINVNKINS
ncbi:MAG: MFS transporter [Candidatus Kapaibacteriota bacterium]